MSRGMLGAAMGAGTATLVLKPDLVTDFAKEAAVYGLTGGRNNSGGSASSSNSQEIAELHKLVEQLARDVNSKQQVTVVHAGGERASNYLLLSVGGLGVVAVLYLRLVKGWTISDFMWVTRRSLRQGFQQVNSGLEGLSARMADIKAKLQARIAELTRKQDETIVAQAQLKAQLKRVGDDVEVTRGQVGQIHGLVLDMEASMSEVGANQRLANQGIYVLCKAVGELMQGSNISSKTELLEFTQQHPVWASGSRNVAGLEGVLEGRDENAGPTGRGPFLLGDGSANSSPKATAAAAAAAASDPDSPVKVTLGDAAAEGGRSSGSIQSQRPPSISYPYYGAAGFMGLKSSNAW